MYFKKTENYTVIPNNLNQVFAVSNKILTSKPELVEMKLEGDLSNVNVAILSFLFKQNYATYQQVVEFCRIQGFYFSNGAVSDYLLQRALDKMLKCRLLNKFFLSDEEQPSVVPVFPEDAQVFYCICTGGVQLLENYDGGVEVYGWDCTSMCKVSDHISRDIAATQFYLRLLDSVADKMKYFNLSPLYVVRTNNNTYPLKASFECMVQQPGEIRYFISDVFREGDSINRVRDKLYGKERLLNTKFYKKYFPDAPKIPNYIAIVENERVLKDVAREIEESYRNKLDCWYILDEYMNRSFRDKVFLTYNYDEMQFIPSMVRVFAS